MRRLAGILVVAALVHAGLLAQGPPPSVPDPATVGPEAATQAYLDTLTPEKKARSDAYFEGDYWLQLWDLLWSAAVLILLLHTGWSSRLRDMAMRVARRGLLAPAVYWFAFLVITSVWDFPLTAYTDFFREHQYGLSTQTFGAWLSID